MKTIQRENPTSASATSTGSPTLTPSMATALHERVSRFLDHDLMHVHSDESDINDDEQQFKRSRKNARNQRIRRQMTYKKIQMQLGGQHSSSNNSKVNTTTKRRSNASASNHNISFHPKNEDEEVIVISKSKEGSSSSTSTSTSFGNNPR